MSDTRLCMRLVAEQTEEFIAREFTLVNRQVKARLLSHFLGDMRQMLSPEIHLQFLNKQMTD